MAMQKVLSHNRYELDQYISETCTYCNEELTNIDDIWIGKDDDNYYCTDCKDYHSIDAVRCRDMDIN